MLKVLGGEQEGEFKAVASGTLPNGKPVVVNADGTVSVVGSETLTDSAGTATSFYEGTPVVVRAAFDSTNNKVLFTYVNQTDYLSVVVGTVNPSDNSITFGTPVIVASSTSTYPDIAFDPTTGKVVVVCGVNVGGIGYYQGTGYVGTVSGDSITFGSGTAYNAASSVYNSVIYDSGADRFVVCYKDQGNSNYGTAAVGALSGSTISWGSEYVWNSGNMSFCRMSYDIAAGKVVLAFRDNANGSYGTAIVGTVAPSTDTISFGSEYVFNTANSVYTDIAYDESAQKHVIAYQDSDTYGKAIVATVSGNAISYGSEVTFEAAESTYQSVVYDSNVNKTAIFYKDGLNSNRGTAIVGTISGTSISFGSPFVYTTADTIYIAGVFDSNSKRVAVGSRNNGGIGSAVASVVTVGGDYPNLTAENYIGMSRGVTDVQATSAGTPVVFEAASTNYVYSIYDPDTNKVIIAYRDTGNSNYGTAIVGTVSGTSITFGSPVVFNSANSFYMNLTYDTVNNKVVIPYQDGGNSNYGTAIVGTVSGTSISFGSPTVFETGTAEYVSSTYDANAQKVVICYQDQQNGPYYGTAVVGTVSGTSISFGTPVVFYSGTMNDTWVVYDSTAQKVVIPYQDEANSNRGVAVVGTVSGTSISFGSPVVFDSGSTDQITAFYESVSGKVLIGYIKTGEGDVVVGTVSGTSISFGTPVAFSSVTASELSITYDTNRSKVVVVYRNSSLVGALNTGTISGDSITFDGEFVFNADAITNTNRAVYDTLNQKVVNTYNDATLSQGTTSVITIGYENRYPVADGNPASLDIIGSVSTNQSGLTAGEKYYVQTDGTLGTTAGSPSVLAGTAISSTELLVKT